MIGSFARGARAAFVQARTGPWLPGSESPPFRLLIVLLVVAAAALRLMRCATGLPYLHFWDEPQTATTALRMMQTGSWNPEFFNYGSATIYLNLFVDVLHFFHLMGQPDSAPAFLTKLSDIKTSFDTGWHWTISHPSFYFWDRVLTAAMGTSTVILVYLLGRRLAGRWAGVLAAALLVSVEFHVHSSALITTDAPVAFLVAATALLSVLFLERGRPAFVVWALVLAGLAASTKYNAALAVLLPLGALVIARLSGAPGWRRWMWAAALLVPAAAFAAGTPYALIEFHKFLRDAGGEIRHYNVVGHGSQTIQPGMTHLVFQARQVTSNLGTYASIAALAGIPALLARRAGWVLLVFPAAYTAFMTGTKVSFHRNFVVLYPFAALAFGAGAVLIWRIAREAAGRRRAVRAAALGGLAVLAGWSLGGSALDAAERSLEAWTVPETRTQAMEKLADLAPAWAHPAEGAKAGISEELRIHESDLKRVKGPFEVRPYLDLICDAARYSVIVGARRYFAHNVAGGPEALFLNEARPAGLPILAEIGGRNPLYVDTISINPGILILGPPRRGEATADVCLDRFPAAELEMSRPYDVDPNGVLQMLQGGEVATPRTLLSPGTYAFAWRARGTWAKGGYAKIKVEASDRMGEAGPRSITGRTIELNAGMARYVLRFDLPGDGLVSLRIEFVNDYWDPKVKEDRNVYLDSFFLVRLSPPGS